VPKTRNRDVSEVKDDNQGTAMVRLTSKLGVESHFEEDEKLETKESTQSCFL